MWSSIRREKAIRETLYPPSDRRKYLFAEYYQYTNDIGGTIGCSPPNFCQFILFLLLLNSLFYWLFYLSMVLCHGHSLYLSICTSFFCLRINFASLTPQRSACSHCSHFTDSCSWSYSSWHILVALVWMVDCCLWLLSLCTSKTKLTRELFCQISFTFSFWGSLCRWLRRRTITLEKFREF